MKMITAVSLLKNNSQLLVNMSNIFSVPACSSGELTVFQNKADRKRRFVFLEVETVTAVKRVNDSQEQ